MVIDGRPAFPAPGADAVAVSARWVAWRAAGVLWVAPAGGAARPVVSGAVGRPALNGATLVYDLAERWIVAVNLATGGTRTLRRFPGGQLRQPSALGGTLLYVRATYKRQQLMAGPIDRSDAKRDRVLFSTVPTGQRDSGHEPGHAHDPGHKGTLWAQAKPGVHDTLWTTALSAHAAYVTRLRQLAGRPVQAAVLRVSR
jgi:hypothetical protein